MNKSLFEVKLLLLLLIEFVTIEALRGLVSDKLDMVIEGSSLDGEDVVVVGDDIVEDKGDEWL